jgi:tRNA A-37 threonylcarbamoyl transferase component Bud32
LIKVAMATQTGPEDPAHGFTPLTVEELAPKFPQLEIIEFIGRGGMGAVYKARQKELDRIVALKILPPGTGDDAAFAERFAREARALARLNHPGIVTIHDTGRADGLYFLIMEFVDGVNLRQLLASGRVSPREALAIVPQICDALQFAHDHGIVHRDIKPENILLDRLGRVKVADFGLAKLVGAQKEVPAGATGSAELTSAGKVMGTPHYMAPEQLDHPDEVDHRADIYALGVVFYQMLTGQLPGKPIEPPSKKLQIDVRLDEIVLRALEKNPDLRYQQASDVKTQIETIAGAPPERTEIQKAPRKGFSAREVPWQIWVVIAMLMVEGAGDLAGIPNQSEELSWLGAKWLCGVGLMLGWRPVFVFFMFTAGVHVVYFASSFPRTAMMNLAMMVLAGSAYRYYFDGKRSERQSWLRTTAVILNTITLVALALAMVYDYSRAGISGQTSAGATPESLTPLDAGQVEEREVNRLVSEFPEAPDFSKPESACAAWQRASARKDAQAINRMSLVKIDPAETERWYHSEEKRDAKGFDIYLKALAESRIVCVQMWHDKLANVITFLPFPNGEGRDPYSARRFGLIGKEWKNLGENRMPSLEAARADFDTMKAVIWKWFQETGQTREVTAHAGKTMDKERMMALVEDFFAHNYRDITKRDTLEWGEVNTGANGNLSIRYKYRATIWDKDIITNNEVFTFDPQGAFVSVRDGHANSKERMMGLVGKFFANNFRDITSRETLDWGDVKTTPDGNSSIRYEYRAKIWDKETVTNNQVFTFDEQDKFVSVKDVPQ